MKHTEKWIKAHQSVAKTANNSGAVNGYTPEQWKAALDGLPPLYTGADVALNDQPFDPAFGFGEATPTSITAAVKAQSPDGAKYVAQLVTDGILPPV